MIAAFTPKTVVLLVSYRRVIVSGNSYMAFDPGACRDSAGHACDSRGGNRSWKH